MEVLEDLLADEIFILGRDSNTIPTHFIFIDNSNHFSFLNLNAGTLFFMCKKIPL